MGNPHSAAKSRVSSFTFAYPGNSFKYCPKISSDESQQEPNLLSVVATTLQSEASNTASSESSDKPTNGSLGLCITEKTQNEISEDVPSAGCSQRRRKHSSQKFDEICSLLKEDILKSGSQNQDQLLSENVDVEVAGIQEMWRSYTISYKEAKNGPRKSKTKSASE